MGLYTNSAPVKSVFLSDLKCVALWMRGITDIRWLGHIGTLSVQPKHEQKRCA